VTTVIATTIMEAIKEAFAKCKAQNRAALITYVTAGFPTVSETPDIMLAMQAGGAGMLFQSCLFHETCTCTTLTFANHNP
jgi:tryptophan synthase